VAPVNNEEKGSLAMPLVRRFLAIQSISEFRREIEGLNEAHRQGHLKAVGNWSLDQCCQHLGRWIEFSIDGFPFRYPWRFRLLCARRGPGLPTG